MLRFLYGPTLTSIHDYWKTYTFDCCRYVASVVSNTVWPHRRQPTRLPRPWDSPGKNTGVGCHFLLQCMKMKSLSHVWFLATPSAYTSLIIVSDCRVCWSAILMFSVSQRLLVCQGTCNITLLSVRYNFLIQIPSGSMQYIHHIYLEYHSLGSKY